MARNGIEKLARRRQRYRTGLLFDLFGLGNLYDLAATVKAFGRYMVAPMHLPGDWISRDGGPA